VIMRITVFAMDGTLYEKSRSLEIHLCDELARQGHDVQVICERELYYSDGDPQPENLSFGVGGVNELTAEELEKIVVVPDADVFFATSIRGCKHTVHFGKKYGKPTVVQILDIPCFRWKYKNYFNEWRGYLSWVKDADVIIVNSSATKNTLSNYFKGLVDSKVRLIYYCIDTRIADSVPDQEKTIDISLVHRLVHHKCTEKLIFALARVKRDYGLVPSVALIGEGPDLVKLIDLAAFAGVPVNFLGPVGDEAKFQVIKASRLFLSTDICEDIGSLASLEAMYCGVRVICSDLMINRERFGEWPVFVESFDICALADAIFSALSKSSVNEEYLREAKEWVVKNRTYKVQAKKTLQVFKELLK